jgi:hypothetical protein
MSHLYIDQKYASIVSSSLEKVKDKSDGRFKLNFRCPLCGDSEKSKYKTRGWLFESNGALFYKCFNCGRSPSFGNFLKEISPVLYNDYRLERFKNDRPNWKAEEVKKEEPPAAIEIKNAVTIASLDEFHPAKKYLIQRKLPRDSFKDLLYVDKFYAWVNENVLPGKFNENALKIDEPRIVFPLKKSDGKVFGFQGRVFGDSKSTTRYITIRLADDTPKIFGLDRYDPSKKGLVVEGPIDSLFLPNCVAMVGAEANVAHVVNKDLTTIIFDNEPRNREIVSAMNKYISNGWKICIWPSNLKPKDINDLVLAGYTSKQVEDIVASNTYQGLEANLKMKFWSKV